MSEKVPIIHRVFQTQHVQMRDTHFRVSIIHLSGELSEIGEKLEDVREALAEKLGKLLRKLDAESVVMSVAQGPGPGDETMNYIIASVPDEGANAVAFYQALTRLSHWTIS